MIIKVHLSPEVSFSHDDAAGRQQLLCVIYDMSALSRKKRNIVCNSRILLLFCWLGNTKKVIGISEVLVSQD